MRPDLFYLITFGVFDFIVLTIWPTLGIRSMQ